MSKSPTSLRTVLIIGTSILLILLAGSLVKYDSLTDFILHWIDQLKARK